MTSGIITTLGLIVGLHSSTHSKIVIIGGVLIIAVSDALSDALGIHISEEYEDRHSSGEVWVSTISTFLSKLIFALTFIAPILLLELYQAIIVSVVWGLSLIAVFSFYISKLKKVSPYKTILEHVFIAFLVIIITHYVGDWIATLS